MGSSMSSSTNQQGGGSLYVADAADSGHYQVIQKNSEKFQ